MHQTSTKRNLLAMILPDEPNFKGKKISLENPLGSTERFVITSPGVILQK